jgi:hypothetical protein
VRELRDVDRRLERRDPVRLAGDEPVLALMPDDRVLPIALTAVAAAVLTLI